MKTTPSLSPGRGSAAVGLPLPGTMRMVLIPILLFVASSGVSFSNPSGRITSATGTPTPTPTPEPTYGPEADVIREAMGLTGYQDIDIVQNGDVTGYVHFFGVMAGAMGEVGMYIHPNPESASETFGAANDTFHGDPAIIGGVYDSEPDPWNLHYFGDGWIKWVNGRYIYTTETGYASMYPPPGPPIPWEYAEALYQAALDHGYITITPSPTPTPSATSTPPPLPIPTPNADLSGDGRVDSEDLFLFMNHWQKASQPIP